MVRYSSIDEIVANPIILLLERERVVGIDNENIILIEHFHCLYLSLKLFDV